MAIGIFIGGVVLIAFYMVVGGMGPKDAAVEVIEDVIEYKTGEEIDLNGKEPKIQLKDITDFEYTHRKKGDRDGFN